MPGIVLAQRARIVGTVADSATRTRLAGAWIRALAGDSTVATALSNGRGRFRLSGLGGGSYTIVVARIGYSPVRLTGMAAGQDDRELSVLMTPRPFVLDPVVVSATLSDETSLATPAAISVVPRMAILRQSVATPIDYVRTVPGVDYAQKGLFSTTFSTRGPRGVTAEAGGLLLLSDYRYTAIPSLNYNIAGFVPNTPDDLERIEVVRGPAAVLFGPNGRRGVIHFITRSPLGPSETSLSLTGGQRSWADGSFRISRRVTPTLGVKLSARYARGNDWEYTDPVEAALRAQALAAGARADTLLIGARRKVAREFHTEARADWALGGGSTLISTASFVQATGVETGSDAGAAQSEDWKYLALQTRFTRRRLFANLMFDGSNAGNTYNLRSGATLLDDSRLVAAQLQHSSEWRTTRFIYGGDFRWTIPRTHGTLNGRFEDQDNVRETGVYVHSTTALSPRLDLSAALRLDHHNKLADEFFLSPRAALVFKPGANHALRLGFNRSFEQPSPRGIFPDLAVAPLGPLPFSIRLEGSAGQGFTFDRSCNGLCMRSPAAFTGGNTGFLPSDATLLWPAIVAILQAQGVDLTGLPAPTKAQVGSRLALLNPVTGGFVPVAAASVQDVPAIRRVVESVVEAGYKGFLNDHLLASVDVYYTRASHVFSTSATVNTPNVFLDPVTLTTYLSQFMPVQVAQQVAAGVASIPVGTVSPREVPGADLLIFQPANQGGSYSFWGADVSLSYDVSRSVSLAGSYSYASKDSTNLGTGFGILLFQAPRHKGSVTLQFQNERRGIRADVRGRAVGGFGVLSPAYAGPVQSYALLDASVGVRLGWLRGAWFTVDGTNLFDHRHTEFVGTPVLGRFIVGRLQLTL
ncbi:MAG TPA: TonB-dependent receptor [Gemmatimonadales bacterium]|nr:TonB-dependent receptor [Gemmatimonadales bacterium]